MSVKLMDCTLRDGGNVVGKGFNAYVTDIVLDGLTACNVPIVEFGNVGGGTADIGEAIMPMLVKDIRLFLNSGSPRFVVNRQFLTK